MYVIGNVDYCWCYLLLLCMNFIGEMT